MPKGLSVKPLSEPDRRALLRWMGREVVTEEHAAKFAVDRKTIRRALAGGGLSEGSRKKILLALRPGLADEQLHRLVKDEFGLDLEDPKPSLALDALVAVGTFDPIDTSARHLISQERNHREQFLLTLQSLRAIADQLRGQPTVGSSNVLAHFYLTLADQLLLSPDPTGIVDASNVIEIAVSEAMGTQDYAARATCLLHKASIAYSNQMFDEGRRARDDALLNIRRIRDQRVQDALMTRFLGDHGRQLIEEGEFELAEVLLRDVITRASYLEDSCQEGSNRAHLGILHLRASDPQSAATWLETAQAKLRMSRSKCRPLQLIIQGKWHALARTGCGDRRGASEVWQDVILECEKYGFAHQALRIRTLRAAADETGRMIRASKRTPSK